MKSMFSLGLVLLCLSANAFAFGSKPPVQTDPDSPADLCAAISHNDLKLAAKALSDGDSVANKKCSNDYYDSLSPLWYALVSYQNANCPNLDMVRFLVKNGANVNEMSGYNSPLSYAISEVKDDAALASALLDLGAVVDTAGSCNNSCGNASSVDLYPSVIGNISSANWAALLSKLIDRGMKLDGLPVNDLRAANSALWISTANMLLAKANPAFDAHLAYTMVDSEASVDMLGWATAHGLSFATASAGVTYTPVQRALARDDLTFVKSLLAATNASLSGADLIYGLSNANADVQSFALQNIADYSTQAADGSTVLMDVLLNRSNISLVQAVLAKKQNLSLERQASPSFALAIAAEYSSADVLQTLLASGADATQVSSVDHDTALLSAVRAANVTNAVALLQKSQSVVNAIGADGNSALTLASYQSETDLVTALTELSGVNLNLQNATGETALMYAVQNRNSAAVVALLAHGACIRTEDSTGHTALEIANDRGFTEILQILQIYLQEANHC